MNTEQTLSETFLHRKPENWNCAQSLFKGFQEQFAIPDAEIERARALGGGRAEDGLCGALCAADYLAGGGHRGELEQAFTQAFGTCRCRELKRNKVPCPDCVRLAHRWVAARLEQQPDPQPAPTTQPRPTPKKVAYLTLGCKLNFAETSHLARLLADEGYERVRPGEEADLCVVNTCSVTDTADHKCRQAIHRLHRQHPRAAIVVTGCYAQLKPREVAAIEGVDLVLGAAEKFDLPAYLRQRQQAVPPGTPAEVHRADIRQATPFRPACSRDGRTRFFLKVQDGCDYFCTYCTIPFARGRSRNAPVADTVDMARRAIAEGAREIVLTGVNTGDFGKSTGERLIDLLRALDALPGDTRIRISSIEPDLLTDDIIRLTAASPHLMPHFHLPLQAGSDEVLRLMHRRYDTALFAHKVQAIRRAIPHAFIGVDVITGVHGETPALFEQGRAFIDALPASQLHVFTYSERAGTRMLQMPHPVPVPERRRRNEILQAISRQKHHAFCESQIGRPARVLWEGRRRADRMAGFTENYVRVEAPYRPRLINTIQPVTLGGWNDDHTALTIES